MTKTRFSKDEQAVLRIEERMFTAIKNRDVKALTRLVTKDFVYRTPGNPDVAKDDFLQGVTTLPVKIVSIWGEEVRVNVYGNLAVLTGLQLARTQTKGGRKRLSAGMFTDILVKRKGTWRMSLAHAVDLPQVPRQYRDKKR